MACGKVLEAQVLEDILAGVVEPEEVRATAACMHTLHSHISFTDF